MLAKHVTFRIYKFMKTSCRYKSRNNSRSIELSFIQKYVYLAMNLVFAIPKCFDKYIYIYNL